MSWVGGVVWCGAETWIVWSRRLSAGGRASPAGHEFVPGRRGRMSGEWDMVGRAGMRSEA